MTYATVSLLQNTNARKFVLLENNKQQYTKFELIHYFVTIKSMRFDYCSTFAAAAPQKFMECCLKGVHTIKSRVI